MDIKKVQHFAVNYEYIALRVIIPRIISTIRYNEYHEKWSFLDYNRENLLQIELILSDALYEEFTHAVVFNIKIHASYLEITVNKANSQIIKHMDKKTADLHLTYAANMKKTSRAGTIKKKLLKIMEK